MTGKKDFESICHTKQNPIDHSQSPIAVANKQEKRSANIHANSKPFHANAGGQAENGEIGDDGKSHRNNIGSTASQWIARGVQG